MIKSQALTRLKETAAKTDLAKEYLALVEAFKPQIQIGAGVKLKSSTDFTGVVTLKTRANVTAAGMKLCAKKAGFAYRHAKTEHEYCFGWNDKKEVQFIYLPNLSLFMVCNY